MDDKKYIGMDVHQASAQGIFGKRSGIDEEFFGAIRPSDAVLQARFRPLAKVGCAPASGTWNNVACPDSPDRTTGSLAFRREFQKHVSNVLSGRHNAPPSAWSNGRSWTTTMRWASFG